MATNDAQNRVERHQGRMRIVRIKAVPRARVYGRPLIGRRSPSPTARGRDPQTAIQAVREAVAAADPYAEAFRSRTLTQMIAEILYPRRMAAAVLFASGLIALLLASVGIYGVMSYSVAQRLGEIGVRRALGAESRDIARLVIGEGLRVAAIGSLAGLVLGYAAIRITSRRFLALPQLDVLTLVLVPLLLAGVVVLACTVPARRATRVDPMDVLRRV